MKRGVYFDAWFPRQHCYHPSLPPRRLRMVDDLVDYRAEVLVWSALGGGSLSLPWLEHEAFGRVDARSRFYGFVNDAEFIAECHRHDIKVFGIVFEAQGWEFPVELDESESQLLAVNELRGVGRRDWIGLREFSANRYPNLWRPWEHYFPDGLVNSEGQEVTDLIEECVARDIHQRPCHARWVECPDRDHECFYMDRNNPVWREYLKAVIRIQIDAGVDGIQLDEAELPMGAMQYGACFCKDCMKGFRSYLADHASEDPNVVDLDLDTFHYGEWLLARGFDFRADQAAAPLFALYYRFQCAAIKTYFGELAEFARAYGREKGREVLVSGNFFNLDPMYYSLVEDVDLVITEMRNTTYRQPEWYRYVRGVAGDKDVVVVENPYGGVVPSLVEDLARGRARDRMRLSLYEGAAFGANMSAPYGSWMGSAIEDSFYAPHDLLVEIQGFLADHEHLFRPGSHHEVAVAYSVESTRALIAEADASDNIDNATDESVLVPYRAVTSALAAAGVPFDVVVFPDGVTAPDRVTDDSLTGYRTLILPDCHTLTGAQRRAVQAQVDRGGRVVALGRLDSELAVPDVARVPLEGFDFNPDGVRALLADGSQVETSVDLSVNVTRLDDGSAALHLLDYAYDAELDQVPEQHEVQVSVRLAFEPTRAVFVQPGRPPRELTIEPVSTTSALSSAPSSTRWSVQVPWFRLYGIVTFERTAA